MEDIKHRPPAVAGITYRVQTPMGTAYIIVNRDSANEAIEVFTNVGKAGSDMAAVSEALGRLISLCLRIPSKLSAADRVGEIVKQLSGIGGGRSIGFGKSRVRSLPDAVARVLAEDQKIESVEEPVEESAEGYTKIGDLCPRCGNATLAHQEGCQKCYSCGYSEC